MASSSVFVAGVVSVAIMVASLFTGASAQAGCTTAIIGLAPCLGFITGNSTAPSTSCCSQLSSVVKSEPQCLCLVLNGGAAQYGISINQTQALKLPNACSVTTPPVSACSTLAGPAASPIPSTTSPAPGGVKNTPSTTGTGSSDGSSIKASFSLAFILLLAYAAAGLASF